MNDQDYRFENQSPQNFPNHPNREAGNEPSCGGAFAKGGCGCLLAFLVLGAFVLLIGGSVHIDPFGAIFLFVIGGVIGLIVLAIYNKGRRDA